MDLRGEYLHAVETARALNDPVHDWDGFRDRLWEHLLPVFGVADEASQFARAPEIVARDAQDHRDQLNR